MAGLNRPFWGRRPRFLGSGNGEWSWTVQRVGRPIAQDRWTCINLSDGHGFGSGQIRRLGRFEGDGAEVDKASIPAVPVVPRFDRGEDGFDHVSP